MEITVKYQDNKIKTTKIEVEFPVYLKNNNISGVIKIPDEHKMIVIGENYDSNEFGRRKMVITEKRNVNIPYILRDLQMGSGDFVEVDESVFETALNNALKFIK